MNTKTDTNSYFGNIDLNDDDFIFNNNEDETTVINPTKYNEDPFMSLKRNYVEKVETNSTGFIKIFTLIFMLMLAGWIAFVIYTSYNPDIITGNDSKSKFGLLPNKVEAKTNNSESDSQSN